MMNINKRIFFTAITVFSILVLGSTSLFSQSSQPQVIPFNVYTTSTVVSYPTVKTTLSGTVTITTTVWQTTTATLVAQGGVVLGYNTLVSPPADVILYSAVLGYNSLVSPPVNMIFYRIALDLQTVVNILTTIITTATVTVTATATVLPTVSVPQVATVSLPIGTSIVTIANTQINLGINERPGLASPYSLLLFALFLGLFVIFSKVYSWAQALAVSSGILLALTLMFFGFDMVAIFVILFGIGIAVWKIFSK